MPTTKSAKKAFRVSLRRAAQNRRTGEAYRKAIKQARSGKLPAGRLASILDQAAKKGVIHWKKAARLKSRLAKRLKTEPGKPARPSRRKKSKTKK